MRRTVVPVLLAAALALSGCASTDVPGSTSTPTPTATATATPTPTPTATPSAAAEVPDPTAGCDTVLTDEEYLALEEDGLTLNPDTVAFDETMQSVMDAGFGCYWTRGGGDVRVWYAQAEQDADSWAAQKQGLVDSGWTQTDAPLDGVLQAPADHDPNYTPAVVHSDGVTYYASYSDYFTSVTALQG